ncbi:MAG: hypothetical protein IPH38_18425 [Candidatus Microthrix sp.]|nr:hypothetical protein [Candidatus Microthrix sp.]MBK7021510.1 hypothetical protein [Candidatus Microthrix sp.]
MPTSTFRWETMALAVGGPFNFLGGTLPTSPGDVWTSTFDAVHPQGLLLHIAWLPPGNVSIPIECTGATGGVGGLFGVVTDANGENEVAAIDAGGAIPSLPFGYVCPPGQTYRPVWAHPGGPLTVRLTTLAPSPGTATGQAFPAEMDLPADAKVPTGTPHEWDMVGGTTTQPPTYTPPTDLSGWHTNEAEGTTLVLEATGLAEGQEIVVPVRPQAGAVRVAMASPANFRPALIHPGGAEPDPSGDGIRIVGPDLDAPRWRMVAAGDVQLTIELDDYDAERVITFAPWITPGSSSDGPDVIANLVALLASELGVPVSSRRSPTATKDSDPSVVVRRTGGPSKGVASDNPTVTIEAWAPTTTESFQLLQSARMVVIEAAEQGRAGLRRYDEFAGPADLPDPSTTNPRHTLTASVVTRLE